MKIAVKRHEEINNYTADCNSEEKKVERVESRLTEWHYLVVRRNLYYVIDVR